MKRIVNLMLILFPLLGIYKLPIGIDIPVNAAVFMVLFAITIVKRKGLHFTFPDGFVLYWVYISVVYILFSPTFNITSFIPGGISFCFWVIALFVGLVYFDYGLLKKYYKLVFFVCAFVFYIQEISYYTFGSRPIFLLPFPLTGEATYQEILANQIRLDRSSCFFREPAHFAQFVLPLLAMELIDAPKNGKIITGFSIFIIATLIMLRSGNGIVGLIVLLAYRIWLYLRYAKWGYKIMTLFVFIPIIIILTSYYIQTEQGAIIAERAAGLGVEEGSGSFMRTVRGYMLFDAMPTINKIFGLTIEGVTEFVPHSRVSYLFISTFTGEYEFYLNGIQTVLVSNGLVGLVLFLLIYIRLYRNNTELSKSLILLFLSLLLIGNLYLSQMMLIATIIPHCKKIEQNRILRSSLQ